MSSLKYLRSCLYAQREWTMLYVDIPVNAHQEFTETLQGCGHKNTVEYVLCTKNYKPLVCGVKVESSLKGGV